jgi:hypothetical protein
VAVVLLSAVGAGAADTTSMTSVKIKAAGVSLQYPNTWTVVPLTKRGWAALKKAASKGNPKLGAVLGALGNVDVSQFKFYAIDAAGAAGTHSNVNVVLGGGGQANITLAELRDQLGQVYKAGGATLVDAKTAKVSGRRAFRTDVSIPFKHPDGTVSYVSEGQLFIAGAASTLVITVTASNDASGSALINAVLASVHHI